MERYLLGGIVGVLLGLILASAVAVANGLVDWTAVTAVFTAVLAVTGIAYTIGTFKIWSATQRSVRAALQSVRQQTATERFRIAFDQNWALYDRRRELPAALPAWKGLSDRGWAWRVIHLNHLNLLQFTWEEYQDGSFSDEQFEGWSRMGKSWFSHLAAGEDRDLAEGRSQLQVILRERDGYRREFLDWLKQNEIVPASFFQSE